MPAPTPTPTERLTRPGPQALAVRGLRVGHAQNLVGYTGVTVLLFDAPTPAGASFCGRATSTRQADGLRPDHLVTSVNAFLFTGGSAFGLDATGGVLRYLAERKIGLQTRYAPIPVCPTAALYDLGFGRADIYPDAALAYAACESASTDPVLQGSVGAGCGATVGKLFAVPQAMKGGFGCAVAHDGALIAQAFVACNGFGDVRDPHSGVIIAGARTAPDSMDFLDSAKAIAEGKLPPGFGQPPVKPSGQNTVLCAVVTNARLDKSACCEAAQLAVPGLERSLSPALSPFDGDVVFLAATGEIEATPGQVGMLAAEAIAQAIVFGVHAADGFGLLPDVVSRLALLEENGD
jgi:L-aminopeptidase/D-esterase-like protein